KTMKKRTTTAFIAFIAAFTFACATDGARNNNSTSAPDNNVKSADESVTSDDLLRHIKALSSDEFEGRGPGTKGEELSVNYLTEQFKRIGLKPGNPDGSYTQKVPLVGFAGQPVASFTAGA